MRQFTGAKTINGVIVHHSRRLHKGVTDDRPHETEAPLAQLLAQGHRLGALGRHLIHSPPGILYGLVADEPPDAGIKRPKLRLHGQESPGIANGGFQLAPMADDGRICQQFLNLGFVEGAPWRDCNRLTV